MKAGIFAAAVAAMSVSGFAMADEIAGNWKISGDIVGNAVDVVCVFAGSGDKVTSACGPAGMPGAPAPVKVAGADVTWDWDAGQAVLTFKGKLEGGKMKGDIETSGVTGSFTASK